MRSRQSALAARTSINVSHDWAEPQWGQTKLFPTEALARYRGRCVANAGCKRVSASVGELSLRLEGDATKTHYLARELLRGREPLSKAARRMWATARFRGRPHTVLEARVADSRSCSDVIVVEWTMLSAV